MDPPPESLDIPLGPGLIRLVELLSDPGVIERLARPSVWVADTPVFDKFLGSPTDITELTPG